MRFIKDIDGDYMNVDYITEICIKPHFGGGASICATFSGNEEYYATFGTYETLEIAKTALAMLMRDLVIDVPGIIEAPDEEGAKKATEIGKVRGALETLPNGLQSDIANVDWSVRTYNVLTRAGIKTMNDLANMTLKELKAIRNIGAKSLDEVKATAAKYGITFEEK